MTDKVESALSEEDTVISNISRQLAPFDIRTKQYPETGPLFRKAAVLLPLAIRNGEIWLLLTKRSPDMRTHASNVSFPGGTRDEGDLSHIDTALREAKEEIGLPPSSVQVLGLLSRGLVLPNNVVYTVVGIIPSDFQPKINELEVQSAFYIPLKEFISSRVVNLEIKYKDETFLTPKLDYDNGEENYFIYGFTAVHCIILAWVIFGVNDPVEMLDGLDKYFDLVTERVKSKLNPKL